MSWRKVKLRELVEPFSERAKGNGGSEGLEFFGVSNEVGITKSKYAAEDKAEDYKIIEQGCFAYNPYRINVGSIAYLNEDVKGLISPAYVVFKPKEKAVKAELLLKFLKSAEGLRQIKLHARGTVRQALRFEDLCKIELHLPDYDEQEILFEKLNAVQDEANELETELTHQQDLLKQLRQAFLREAMQGKLGKSEKGKVKREETGRELLEKIKAEKEKLITEKKLRKEKSLPPIKEEEIPFGIPENWVWCRLGEIADNIEYGTSEKADLNPSNVPVLRMNNIQDGKLDFENLKYVKSSIEDLPKLYLKNGDLLFNRTNSWELVGKSGVYHGEDDIMTFASYLIRVQFGENVSCDFINAYINSSLCRTTQLEPDIIQQNGQANFNGTKLKNIICPLPPLSEQKRIVKKLEEVMNLCDELKTTITNNQTFTNQLLQVALKDALQMKEVKN